CEPWTPPTGICGRALCRLSTLALARKLWNLAVRSLPMRARYWTTFCAISIGTLGATTACRGLARSLQIPGQRHRHHYVKATVRVHEYPDGQLAVFDGPSCLARFDRAGKPIDASRAA